MTLWQRIVQANRPGPPEHSVTFRVASAGTVVVGVLACHSQGELSPAVTVFAVVATVVGNIVSYWRRSRPWPAVKPILAVVAVSGFVWFIITVNATATPGDISTVESPLAVLFAWVLSTHSFDVPARRDVAYSLAGSAGLMAVAAAQSVDLAFGIYVAMWLVLGMWALVAMWQSMSGTRGVPWLAVCTAGTVLLVLSALLVIVLPAPKVSTSLLFPSSAANSSPVETPNDLTDGSATLPAHAANPSGPTRVGGFLGFAKSLNTGVRASLGNEIVMRVRATRPSFWVGQTYDTWTGQSWLESGPTRGKGVAKLGGGSPFEIPASADELAGRSSGATNVQTFYLAESGPNLVFHADNAQRVYVQSPSLYLTGNGTIVSANSMGSGTIYTVISADNTASPEQLRTAGSLAAGYPEAPTLSQEQLSQYLLLPHAYPRVANLARSITSSTSPGDPNPSTYDKVAAIELWMSRHIHYTTDIPPLAPGSDAVTSFLFGSRLGYCEQISTATVVMLRSLGIPARETVGYVPGSYDPITDLYDVEAKDAHAWVQVWFPGYGWQNFDPTADVPLANPSPGSVLTAAAGRTLAHLPWIPIGIALVLVAAIYAIARARVRRPPTWAHRIASDLEHGGARHGDRRRAGETLSGYARRLGNDDPLYGNRERLIAATQLVERYSYAGMEPSADEIANAVAFTHEYRRHRRRRRRTANRIDQDRVTASASSKEAPAASSGR
jgi:protein-glutamine gamma-glutamyltransferase